MKKIWKWFADKMLAQLILLVLGIYIKYRIDLPIDKRTNIFNLNGLIDFFNTGITLWKIIVFVIIIMIIRFVRIQIKTQNKQPVDEIKSYKVDIFGATQSKWTWRYEYDVFAGQNTIIDVYPCCPVCSSTMDKNYSSANFIGSTYVCPKCRLEGTNYYHQVIEQKDDVTREILRRIEIKQQITV